jgi:hypothetical protein
MDIMSQRPDSLGNRGKALLPKDIYRDSPENTKVNQSRTTTQRRLILFENNILDPMKAILNMPMCLNSQGKLRSSFGERANIKHFLLKRLLLSNPSSFYLNNPLNSNPDWIDPFCRSQYTNTALDLSAMTRIGLNICINLNSLLKLSVQFLKEQREDAPKPDLDSASQPELA